MRDLRQEVADELDALALKMRSTAAKMQMIQDGVIVAHGNEMAGASELAREWAKEIKAEAQLPSASAKIQTNTSGFGAKTCK